MVKLVWSSVIPRGISLLRDIRLITTSGLFDSDWYLRQNPDVAKAGVNPLRHYVRRGATEGRDPNPLFDSDWYLQQNQDVAKAGVNPLVHYILRGVIEGRDPNPLFDTSYYLETNPDVAAAGINPLFHFLRYGAHEGRLARPPAAPQNGAASELEQNSEIPLVSFDDTIASMLKTIFSFCLAHGRIDYVLATNFHVGAGADVASLGYVRFWSNVKNIPVLLVMTDNGPRRPLPELPANVLAVDLTNVFPGTTQEQREAILKRLLRIVDPRVLHIVNSEVAWNLIQNNPATFLPHTAVIGSVFALQFARQDPARLVGFAARYLPPCIEKIDAVVTDNATFAEDAPRRLGLEAHASKFTVIHNACKLEGNIDLSTARKQLQARLADLVGSLRLRVIWAGRIDIEKRIDLLIQIAQETRDLCDFRIFGSSVLDGQEIEAQLAKLDNVEMCGPFESPFEWDDRTPGHVFLFTSVWEGMPNSLIEAAFLGYPIIAPAVGGIPELITPCTGWPVAPDAPASVYAAHLRSMVDRSKEILGRVERLLAIVHERHSRAAHEAAMSQLAVIIERSSPKAAMTNTAADARRHMIQCS